MSKGPTVGVVYGDSGNKLFLHPNYDFIPDPSDDRYYVCECGFFVPRTDEAAWIDHEGEGHQLASRPIPVHSGPDVHALPNFEREPQLQPARVNKGGRRGV